MKMLRRSKSANGPSEKVPLTPDHAIMNDTENDSNSISRSTTKTISKILIGSSSKSKHLNAPSSSFRTHLKHLNFNDKENNNKPSNKQEKYIKTENGSKIKSKHINCSTSSPFEYGCIFWEIEWNAIEIELKTKTNGVIRSVPMEVGGHQWFVELYPKVNNQKLKIITPNDENVTVANNKHKNNTTPNVQHCKFNIFVKSKKNSNSRKICSVLYQRSKG